MRAATEGSLPPVMPQGNLVEVLGREVRQGSPGELMMESSPSRQTNKEKSDEAADVAALTYLLTYYVHTAERLLSKRFRLGTNQGVEVVAADVVCTFVLHSLDMVYRQP